MKYKIAEHQSHSDGHKYYREEYRQTADGVVDEVIDNLLYNNIKNLKVKLVALIKDSYRERNYIYIYATGYVSCGGDSEFWMYIYCQNDNGKYLSITDDSMVLKRVCTASPLLGYCVERTKKNLTPIVIPR